MSGTAWPLAQREKELQVREWVRAKLGGIDHELRVAAIAEKLFDVTSRWHGLGVADRRLLSLAAVVHDVGRANCSKGHAKEGAQMVLGASHLPLSEAERRRLAFL